MQVKELLGFFLDSAHAKQMNQIKRAPKLKTPLGLFLERINYN